MANDKKRKPTDTVGHVMSAYDRFISGRGSVDVDEIRKEAERKRMEDFGLDEQAYEQFKLMPPRPKGQKTGGIVGAGIGYVPPQPTNDQKVYDARLAELRKQSQERDAARRRDELEARRRKLRGEDYGPRASGSDQTRPAQTQPAQTQPAQTQPAQTQQTTAKLANGTQKAKKDPPLTRKGANPPAVPKVVPHDRFNEPNGVTLNGVPVGGQTETQSKLQAANRNNAAVLEHNSNIARKDAAAAERKSDAERGQRETRERLERADSNKEYWDKRLAARNEELYDKKRANTKEEWENLGRLRGDEARDGKALTDDEYNTRLKGLYDRAAALRKNQKANAYLKASDASAMQSFFKNVGKVTFDDKGNAVHANGKRFTNAQLQALADNITKYEGLSSKRQADLAARTKAAKARGLLDLRARYGLDERDSSGAFVFTDDDVRNFHKGKTSADVKSILSAMAADGTPKNAEGYDDFASRWDALAKSGADFQGAYDHALKGMDAETKAQYMNALADAPDVEARQTIRQNTILNQLYKENGITSPGDVGDRRSMPGEVVRDYETTLDRNLASGELERKLADSHRPGLAQRMGAESPAPKPAPEPIPGADVIKPKPSAGNAPEDPGLMPELTPRADPLATLNKPDSLAAAGFKVPGERDPNKLVSDEQAIASMNSAEDKADVAKAIEIDEKALRGPTPEERENRFARRMAKSMGY